MKSRSIPAETRRGFLLEPARSGVYNPRTMKKTLITLLATSLFASLLAYAQSAEQKLHDADQAWMKAVAARDLKGTLAAFEDDASVLPQNSPQLKGHEAIGKFFGEMFQAPELKIEWHPLKVEVAKSGDLGYTTGVYADSVKDPASGKTVEDHGKYLTVWKKQKDGSWKVQYDIFNTDLPEATH
jgi:uncharacterized protein (TIGR02246 family)